jgi:hypothetical protein
MGQLPMKMGERRVDVVPQKEPYFQPLIQRIGRREVKVGINSTPDLTKLSTLPKVDAYVPEPGYSRA